MQNEDRKFLELPGHWIDHPDREWAFLIKRLLQELLDQLHEARIVFVLFNEKNEMGFRLSEDDSILHHLYAKSFVYALDAACQIIRVLRQEKDLPEKAIEQCNLFIFHFGKLHELRNSLQHIEDRLRCLGRNGKLIPGSIIAMGIFRYDHLGATPHFGATTSDGQIIEIEISRLKLDQALNIIEDLIWCFNWLGGGSIRIERQNPEIKMMNDRSSPE